MLAPVTPLDACRSAVVAFPSRRPARPSPAAGALATGKPCHASRPATTVLAFHPRAVSLAVAASQSPARCADAPAELADAASAHALTVADRVALLSWFNGGSSGYARFVFETGLVGGSPDCSGYALLYSRGSPWAVLGVTRVAAGILVWHCGSGVTHGVYPDMAEALRTLPKPP